MGMDMRDGVHHIHPTFYLASLISTQNVESGVAALRGEDEEKAKSQGGRSVV